MEEKRFKMIDEEFTCQICGKLVKPLGYTARDHCLYCLCSVHVDINPGDRKSECQGILRPIAVEKAKKSGFKIIYKCDKCGEIKRNIMASDDNMDKIIEIMSNPIKVE